MQEGKYSVKGTRVKGAHNKENQDNQVKGKQEHIIKYQGNKSVLN